MTRPRRGHRRNLKRRPHPLFLLAPPPSRLQVTGVTPPRARQGAARERERTPVCRHPETTAQRDHDRTQAPTELQMNARGVEHFPEKWLPDFRMKCDKTKILERSRSAPCFAEVGQLLPHLADLGPGVTHSLEVGKRKLIAADRARQGLPRYRHRDRRAGARARRVGGDGGCFARVAEIVDEDFALAQRLGHFGEIRSGASAAIPPAIVAQKALVVSQSAPSIGTTTCRPLPPESLTKLFSFSSASRSRVSAAAATIAFQATSSPGSRSNTIRSQISSCASREPRTWISSAPDCTSSIRSSSVWTAMTSCSLALTRWRSEDSLMVEAMCF